ncbi:TPA: hypothetical protein HA265_07480 [Candidatus Woesearchaeota archaeon]|nr:hypothetical protein [Candidatus Woesearchaeota archaeon]
MTDAITLFELPDAEKKKKTTFASMINQKELSSEDLDDLFLEDELAEMPMIDVE